MKLTGFQSFLKSLDMNRTKENYEELVKIKQLQVKFFYKQQMIMEISERLIFRIHNLEEKLNELNSIEEDNISQRYIKLYYFNQKLIRSFVIGYESAIVDYKSISNKIELVLKDALTLLFNCVLNEQEYLLTKSYLTKIKNRFHNQLGQLEDSYKDFKCFINDELSNSDEYNDLNNNQSCV